MTRLGIASVLIFNALASVCAAADLADAFKDGKLEGRVRAHYISTDWEEDVIATAIRGDHARGLAVGGSLIFETAPVRGLSFGAGLYTTQNPFGYTQRSWGLRANTSKDLFARGPGPLYQYGEGYSVLAQSYGEYQAFKSKLTVGRFLISNPWISPNDTKMIPVAVEAVEILSSDLRDTTLQVSYARKIKERGMDYFGNMADTADTPVAIRNWYATHYGNGTHGQAPDVLMAGVANKSLDRLDLQAGLMHWNDLVDQGRIEANLAIKLRGTKVGLGALYVQQFDQGAGQIILPGINNGDDDNSLDTYLVAFKASASFGAAKFLVAWSRTDDGADLLAPWRAFPTQGYTRSMTITDWNADTSAYKAGFDYDWTSMLSGLSTALSYSFYDRDPARRPYVNMTNRGFQNGDTSQWNLDVTYKIAGALKGTELKVRLMDQSNDVTLSNPRDTSNREMRLEANYRF